MRDQSAVLECHSIRFHSLPDALSRDQPILYVYEHYNTIIINTNPKERETHPPESSFSSNSFCAILLGLGGPVHLRWLVLTMF